MKATAKGETSSATPRSALHRKKPTPRVLHRQTRLLRASQAAPLIDRFPNLKSLTVEFAYLTPHGQSRNREVKFTVNVEKASSVVVIDCMNPECVGGDFELTEILGQAVADRQTRVTGELECPGATSVGAGGDKPCGQRITYVLTLGLTRR